jgi:hypothetical protein
MGVKFSVFKHHYQTGKVNYHYTKTSQDQDTHDPVTQNSQAGSKCIQNSEIKKKKKSYFKDCKC